MTLKARISLGIGFLLIVILVLSGLSYYSLKSIDQRNQLVVNENFVRLNAIEATTSELNKLSAGLLSFDEVLNKRVLDEFDLVFQEKIALVEGVEVSASEKYLIKNLKSDAEKLVSWLRTEVVGKPVDNVEARTAAVTLISQISGALHSLFENNKSNVLLSMAENNAETSFARRFMLALGILCILFAISILVWLPGSVTDPIKRFGESIRLISQGDYKTRLRSNRKDEFGNLAETFNEMAEQLQKVSTLNLDEIVSSRKRLRTLVNNLTDSILGMDANRNIVFLNNAMEEFIGISNEEAMGAYLPDLALEHPIVQQLFTPIALGRSESKVAIEVKDGKGKSHYFQERVVEILASDNTISGYIILLTDVTDYENRTQRQTDFLAQLSHEMKTPISAIHMSLNLLEDERLEPISNDQKELTSTIRKNSDRLLHMVNEVLQLSQNEYTDVKLKLDTIDLASLIKETVAFQKTQLNAKSIEVQFVFQADNLKVEGDASKLRLVLDNLLSNAIRYAPVDSQIQFQLNAIPGGVAIVVKDEGPGIDFEFQSKLFEKYERSTSDNTKGTGLGLSICKDYILAHGGRIYLDNSYTAGAAFVVELSRQLPRELRRKHATF